MPASTELWDKFRKAQKLKAGDAAFAYQHAIDHENKGKMKEAAWWEKMGDDAMPTEREHASR